MRLDQQRINELWRIGLDRLNRRSAGWIVESFPFVLLMYLALAMVKQFSILMTLFSSGSYVAFSAIVYVVTRRIKQKRFHAPYSHNVYLLLHQGYDFVSMLVLAFVFWGIGDDMIYRSGVLNVQALRLAHIYTWTALALSVSIAFFLGPTLAVRKIDSQLMVKPGSGVVPILLVLRALPGLALLIGLLLVRTGRNLPNDG